MVLYMEEEIKTEVVHQEKVPPLQLICMMETSMVVYMVVPIKREQFMEI